ncbi:MAG: hypothetical protein EA353_13020 [Puniceicoccaceae bacterium]|nr:MAG: hypothetical protein EA353_13020 [Puniceicoccaceae bacterium]
MVENGKQAASRAPALYLLIAIILGYCTAKLVAAPVFPAIGLAIGFCLASLLTAHKKSLLWLLCFTLAATLGAWSYATLRLPERPDADRANLPIREASILFKVDRVMQARTAYGSASGLGRVVEADRMSRLAPNDLIYFRGRLPDSGEFDLQRGSQLQATGLLQVILPDSESSSFDIYLHDIGAYYRFTRIQSFESVSEPGRFAQFSQNMNQRFQYFLRLGAPEGRELDRVYIAMLLGHKAELTREQRDRFRTSGTMHFFAISGLHIGVIATVLAQALLLIRVPRRISPFIGLPLLYLYVEITGASPSAVRAFLMALFFWMSFAFSRQRSPLAALAASAIFVLIIAPEQLWGLGFQLSYIVVLSILLFGLPFYKVIGSYYSPFKYLAKEDWALWQRIYARLYDITILTFSVSFSAWLASAPLSAAFFGYFSPTAIILNLLLVNLVALAITTGVLSLSLSLLGLESLSQFINHAAWLTIQIMDSLVIGFTKVPGSVVFTEDFSRWITYTTLLLYFALLFYIQHRKTHLGQPRLAYFCPPAIIIFGILYGL